MKRGKVEEHEKTERETEIKKKKQVKKEEK